MSIDDYKTIILITLKSVEDAPCPAALNFQPRFNFLCKKKHMSLVCVKGSTVKRHMGVSVRAFKGDLPEKEDIS